MITIVIGLSTIEGTPERIGKLLRTHVRENGRFSGLRITLELPGSTRIDGICRGRELLALARQITCHRRREARAA
ncbi:MAG: hypothetical protein UY92_C0009G0072 [Candidatus Magasanikbacteria bacterium GW2011_GWA2_56_11]|uniref:Uncharacterized protein n=1 Tax=Candidatus Magasanikbacteria bacterium GW2011_GWA2_56_11 TaxID=1619044 RepID=A0A0G1YFQ6_9BACT|nr:MAG: hypothetical protein UY92_C0009G0072 [Candidatus Magasanikbacteria bacterium GW2011_GWA2_56_11]